ncbi:MAG: hypothetical protein ABL921_03670 [Pirellula sp.]
MNMNSVLHDEVLETAVPSLNGPWNDVAGIWEFWNRCDTILCNQQYFEQASQHFDPSKLLMLRERPTIWEIIHQNPDRKFDTVGVLSPALLSLLLSQHTSAEILGRYWCNQLLIWRDADCPSVRELRRGLHQAGYYEIAEVVPDASAPLFDYSSVSHSASGEYELLVRSLERADRPADEPRSLIASRFGLAHASSWNWNMPSEFMIKDNEGGIVSERDDSIRLALRGCVEPTTEGDGIRVGAKVEWESNPMDGSFAGLVAAYSGPGDSNMIMLTIEAFEPEYASLAIWECQDQWRKSMTMSVPFRSSPRNSVSIHCVEVTMEIKEHFIDVFLFDSPVVRLYDRKIRGTSSYGVRMRGGQFVIRDLSCQLLPKSESRT